MSSTPEYRVEYSTQKRKCGRKKCKVDPMVRVIRIGELVLVRENTTMHWPCVKAKNRKTMKSCINKADNLNGFSDLQLQDKIRVAKDMGWKSPVSIFNDTNIVNSPGPVLTIQSVSDSEDEVFDVPQFGSTTITSAHNVVGSLDADFIIDPPKASSFSRVHFEPIISVPLGPLPPLDFRFRTPAVIPSHAAITSTSNIDAYIQNPTSIIGRKFRFIDGNRIWDASEIVFGKKGWGTVTFEGPEGENHRFDIEVLISMLKHGVLDEA